MSKINDELLGHADESDGIEEYDNPLPDWWVGMFILTILWAGYYFIDWHVISPKSQAMLYDKEVAAATEKWPELQRGAAFDDSPETLALGAELFAANCASCHGTNLEGGIGPNLVDDEWVHGGSFADIVGVIESGVAAKGMPAWGPILGPKRIAATASYILSKGGSEPAAAAEPAPAEPGDQVAVAAAGTTDGEAPEAGGSVDEGKRVFTQYCVACHMADMTGGVGPNLVDDEWIHGGELEDIRRIIEVGVPAKGMISWKGTLSEAEIDAVARYVHAGEP